MPGLGVRVIWDLNPKPLCLRQLLGWTVFIVAYPFPGPLHFVTLWASPTLICS